MILIFSLFSSFAQTTFYVALSGKDSSSCGSQNDPCYSINQVFTNYPGVNFTAALDVGTYATDAIVLMRDAYVVFQGSKEVTVATNQPSGAFIVNTDWSGFEFRDLIVSVAGKGNQFTVLNAGGNTASFCNISLTFSPEYNGNFVEVICGTVLFSNVTVQNISFNSCLIISGEDFNSENTSIMIRETSFLNLEIGSAGALLLFEALRRADIEVTSCTFANISSQYAIFAITLIDVNQNTIITTCSFRDVSSYIPSITCVCMTPSSSLLVQTSDWRNVSAATVAGAIQAFGNPNDGEGNITLVTLTFAGCIGPYAGAVLIGYTTLFNVSDCSFSDNSGYYCDDVALFVDGNFECFLNEKEKGVRMKVAFSSFVAADDMTDSDALVDLLQLANNAKEITLEDFSSLGNQHRGE